MPYLAEKRKKELDDGLRPSTPGDLTYRLTLIALNSEVDDWLDYMKGEILQYMEGRAQNFALLSEVVGCIACARLEWSRRMPSDDIKVLWWTTVETSFYYALIAPYEDTKIALNGDVYPDTKTEEVIPHPCD